MTSSALSPAPRGLLLVNLGTPAGPDTASVRRYLRQFLSDPRVIDLPAPARWALVHLVIAPFRAPRSARAYRQIWTERGSPLLVHTQDLRDAVAARLGEGWVVTLAMRYGAPAIDLALDELRAQGVQRLVVLPLYPQYAASTTGSTAAAIYRACTGRWDPHMLTVVPPFFADDGFLSAWAHVAAPHLTRAQPEAVVLSFHGLPVRHLERSHPAGHACQADAACCERLHLGNNRCYRAQCFATARALTERLGLDPAAVHVSFQSRLGRAEWIGPDTMAVLTRLAAEGVRDVAVLCPSFVADCLETTEEIGLRAREHFLAAGGRELTLVPSLNATDPWADAVADLARRAG